MSEVYLKRRQKTRNVIILTFVTMVIEIVAGMWTGSLALLADGWHMGSHVGALAITYITYSLATSKKFSNAFAFGGGKVLSLGGYTSAMLLFMTALWMVVEAIERFMHPQAIKFDEAMVVAIVGLLVNAASALMLQDDHAHGDAHHEHEHSEHKHHHHHEHDHNHASAYLHVITDALTSALAIAALAVGKWLDWWWADPAMALVGAVLILKWAIDLLKKTSMDLLDAKAKGPSEAELVTLLTPYHLQLSCFHLWSVGPGKTTLQLSVLGSENLQSLTKLRVELEQRYQLAHVVIDLSSEGRNCPWDEKQA